MPSLKSQASSYFCGITSLPVLSMKPHLPLSFTLAKPSENRPTRSNLGFITILLFRSQKPPPYGIGSELAARFDVWATKGWPTLDEGNERVPIDIPTLGL